MAIQLKLLTVFTERLLQVQRLLVGGLDRDRLCFIELPGSPATNDQVAITVFDQPGDVSQQVDMRVTDTQSSPCAMPVQLPLADHFAQ